MKKLTIFAIALCASWLAAGSAQAAFIVGGHASEKGNANFGFGGDTTTAGNSVPSAAVGLIGTNSRFGGDGVNLGDTYVFRYTPGVDLDNTVFVPGTVLGSTTGFPGNGNLASGLPGGLSGRYNVYFTTPESTNVSATGSNFHLTQNGATIDLNGVILNNTGTGADTDPGTAFVGGANNAWHLLGTVDLVAGTTYTVTQDANTNSFVSQRAHAVMWELAIPEPASLSLAGAMLAALIAARRR
jgi:hypothetical protein